jgi:hypothetical protein
VNRCSGSSSSRFELPIFDTQSVQLSTADAAERQRFQLLTLEPVQLGCDLRGGPAVDLGLRFGGRPGRRFIGGPSLGRRRLGFGCRPGSHLSAQLLGFVREQPTLCNVVLPANPLRLGLQLLASLFLV